MKDSIATCLERQAEACGEMGSPLYDTLLRLAAADHRAGGPVRALFDADPVRGGQTVIGIRLMGAFHRCALDGSAPAIAAHFPSCGGDGDALRAWPAMRAVLEERLQRVGELFETTPQTNEVARSTLLLAGLLAVAARTTLPIRLLDAGASAGLNARLDRYRYAGADWRWGDMDSPLILRNRTVRGRPLHLDASLRIVDRAACDLHPLDIGREDDRVILRSFVWADQIDRLDRLNRAIEAASALPLIVEAADMLDWIPARAIPSHGIATVIMHSIVSEHLSDDARELVYAAIRRAGEAATAEAPVAWLRLEASETACDTRVTFWPAGEERLIARSDGHGQAIAWNGPE
jgi:hypothetical protein